jgi:hypothetical protein
VPDFKLTRPPPATRVGKTLLVELENYIIGQAARVTDKSIEELKSDFNIVIVDKFGTETLKSASELKGEKLPDSIKDLKVQFKPFTSAGLSINIEFARLRMESSIDISQRGPDARETVMGIYTELQRLLKTESTYAWLFHWPGLSGLVELTLPVAGVVILSVLVIVLVAAQTVTARLLFAWTALVLFLFLIAFFLKPFSAFDSRRQKSFDETWKWLSLGTLGFLVFGTVFPALRKWIADF